MRSRVWSWPRRRYLLLFPVLIALVPMLGACTSGTVSDASSSGINLAPFEQAVAADYKGEFTAPPTSAPPHKKGVNLWIISCGQASEGCSAPVANAKEAAQALGWKATVFDGNFGIGDAYNAGIRQAIADHAQAIITVGVNCNQAKAGYQAAKAAGILLVGAESYDCTDPAVNDGPALFSATTLFTAKYPSAAARPRRTGSSSTPRATRR
jgi:ribose transport system substrate-binding protein